MSNRSRTFASQSQQIPLTSGTVASVHKAQGETLDDVLLDLRKTEGPSPDMAIVYVAISRATCLESLKLLFPLTLHQLRVTRDADNMALMAWIQAQYRKHREGFLGPGDEQSSHDPTGGSVNPGIGLGRNEGTIAPRLWIPRNSNNNCFFNSVLAVMLSLSDTGREIDSCLTPAGGWFFLAVQQVCDHMYLGSLPSTVLVSRVRGVYYVPCACCRLP